MSKILKSKKSVLWLLFGGVLFFTQALIGMQPGWVAKYPKKQQENALQDRNYVFAQSKQLENVAELLLRNTPYQQDKGETVTFEQKPKPAKKEPVRKVDPLLVLKEMIKGDFGGKSGQALEDDFEKSVAIAVKLVQSKNQKIRKQAHEFLLVLLKKNQGFDQVRALLKRNSSVDAPWKQELVGILGDSYKNLVPEVKTEQPKIGEGVESLKELKQALQMELEKISQVLTEKVLRKMGYPAQADQAVIREFFKVFDTNTAYVADDLEALKKFLVDEVVPLDEIVSQRDDAGLCIKLIDRILTSLPKA